MNYVRARGASHGTSVDALRGHIFFHKNRTRWKHHHPQGQGSGGVPRTVGVTLLKSCALCDSLDYFLALCCCPAHNLTGHSPAHSGSKRLKPAENKFTQSGFTSYSVQVSANKNSFRFRSWRVLHIQILSNRCRQKYEPSISRVFELIFGGFSTFGPTARARAQEACAWSGSTRCCFTFLGKKKGT